MRSPYLSLKINLGLLFSALIMIFSGLLIQIKYHMGNHNGIENNTVWGLNYTDWSTIHKISIVLLSLIMIFHIYQHWKWYSTVIKKRLISKNKQVLTLSVLFILVAVTGFIPWLINLLEGNLMVRKAFIEIHDKFAIILSIYIISHIIKRLKWFFATFEKIKINTAHNTRYASF